MGGGDVEAGLRGERLEAERTVGDLEAELAGIVAQQVDVAPDDEHDAEGSTIGFERARVTALLAHARRALADLERALAQVAAGTYGRCGTCGRPIPDERLTARPTATTCVVCAREAARAGSDRSLRGRRP